MWTSYSLIPYMFIEPLAASDFPQGISLFKISQRENQTQLGMDHSSNACTQHIRDTTLPSENSGSSRREKTWL